MSPRTNEQFDSIRKASIENIVQAAMKLFSVHGYLSVSVKDIAREAGISQGLMYNYFKSKEKLLLYIVDLMIAEMNELMASADTYKTPEDQLMFIIRSPFQMLRTKKEFWEMILPILTQRSVNVKIRKQLQALFQAAVLQLGGIFKALKVPKAKQEAYKLGAILDGIGWHYLFIFSGDYPLDEIEAKLLADYKYLIQTKTR